MSNPPFKPSYALHCFFCGDLLIKGEFFRYGTYPMCPMCYAEEIQEFKKKRQMEKHPNWTEQDDIDETNYQKYGEC